MDMETSGTNHQDVAEPGGMASGGVGTGQEHRNPKGPAASCGRKKKERRDRIVIGLGVLDPGRGAPLPEPPAPHPVAPDGNEVREESPGDLVFTLFERQERIAERLDRKIERLARRLDRIEKRGRD